MIDAVGERNLAQRLAGRHTLQGFARLMLRQFRPATEPLALGHGTGTALIGPLQNQIPFKFGNAAQHRGPRCLIRQRRLQRMKPRFEQQSLCPGPTDRLKVRSRASSSSGVKCTVAGKLISFKPDWSAQNELELHQNYVRAEIGGRCGVGQTARRLTFTLWTRLVLHPHAHRYRDCAHAKCSHNPKRSASEALVQHA